jgi:hypothetical protein
MVILVASSCPHALNDGLEGGPDLVGRCRPGLSGKRIWLGPNAHTFDGQSARRLPGTITYGHCENSPFGSSSILLIAIPEQSEEKAPASVSQDLTGAAGTEAHGPDGARFPKSHLGVNRPSAADVANLLRSEFRKRARSLPFPQCLYAAGLTAFRTPDVPRFGEGLRRQAGLRSSARAGVGK